MGEGKFPLEIYKRYMVHLIVDYMDVYILFLPGITAHFYTRSVD
jgi:hypothetical protein